MKNTLYPAVLRVLEQVNRVILGKDEKIREIMTAFLANGHVLLEDIPGVGKTTLAVAFSRAMQLDYRRVQFTPDVLPSDLTGFSVYRREEEKFVYQPGSVFCNLLLADEINRTSPKTQSALLEVMEERKVTVDGETREVEPPFLVIATQNPTGTTGTQYLPEAQREIYQVYMKDVIYDYALKLVRVTRGHTVLERGASPRATIALVKMAKASAWMDGRDYVTPGDVSGQFPYVVSHRVSVSGAARMEGRTKEQILRDTIENVEIPPMGEERK